MRTAYRFPFSDQVFFPQTLGARTAVSRLALDPPWLGRLLSALVRLGVPAVMRRHGGARERFQRIHAWLQGWYEGLDWYGAVVEVGGLRGVVRAGIVGRAQATGAAIGAAALARALIEGEVEQPGDLARGRGRSSGAVLRAPGGTGTRAGRAGEPGARVLVL